MVNEYLADLSLVGTSAPVSATIYRLPFRASHILLINDSAINFRCALTTVLTTSSCMILTTGQQLKLDGLQSGCEVISLLTTTSSTGTALALRLGAWG